MRTPRTLLATSLVILAAACSHSRGPNAAPAPMPSEENESARRGIPVQVDNQNFNDMNVYLIKEGARYLVGNVSGLTKTTLTIPASLAPTDLRVRLRAEPIGGRGATTTPTLIVPAGQQVYWTIGSDPSLSSASAG